MLVAERFQAFLQMQWKRVEDLAADLVLAEVCAQVVSSWGANDVLVEDVFGAGIGVGQDDAFGSGRAGKICDCEKPVIERGQLATPLIPGGNAAQLHLKNSGLNRVQARIPADFLMEVAATHAVGAQDARMVIERCVTSG